MGWGCCTYLCHCRFPVDGFCYTQVISDLIQLRGLLGLQLSQFRTFKCAPGSPGGAAQKAAARLAKTAAVALARARAAASVVARAEATSVGARKEAVKAEVAKAVACVQDALEEADNAKHAA